MKGRSSLPGASELFRTTGHGRPDAGGQDRTPGQGQQQGEQEQSEQEQGEQRHDEQAARRHGASTRVVDSDDAPSQREAARPLPRPSTRRRVSPEAERRPTGRERHDEKITVYVSAEELMDLERARLTLRGEHGLAVDRGRIVREALATVLADLEAAGADSTLVRRLSGA